MYGPDLGDDTGTATQLPNWVMPVHFPFTSNVCKNVPSTPVKLGLNITETVTIIVLPFTWVLDVPMLSVHLLLLNVPPCGNGTPEGSPASLIRRIPLLMRLYTTKHEPAAVYQTMFGVGRKRI